MLLFRLWLGMFTSYHSPDFLMLFAIICHIITIWKTTNRRASENCLVILNSSSKKEKLKKPGRTEQAIYSFEKS